MAPGTVAFAATTPLEPVRVSPLDEREFGATWSGDGRRVAFLRINPATAQTDLYVSDRDGSDAARIVREAVALDWSPTSDKLAMTRTGIEGYSEIWTVNADGTGRTQITHGVPATPSTPRVRFDRAVWSPDGSQLAYTFSLVDSSQGYAGSGVGVMGADGANPHALVTYQYSQPGFVGVDSIDWSPTGVIGFTGFHETPSGETYDLYTVSPIGGPVTQVTSERNWTNFAWSPTGQELAATKRGLNGNDVIQVANADGSNAMTVTPASWPSDASEPEWSPNGVDLLFTTTNPPDESNLGVYSMRLDRALPLSGTVTDSASGQPVPGAWVAALDSVDFTFAAGAVADSQGDYELAVSPGSYYLYLVDPSATHRSGFHGPPTPVTVAAGSASDADVSMAPSGGTLSGTVTAAPTSAPIPLALVLTLSGTTGLPETGAVSNGAGNYTIRNVRPGLHFVGFVDPTGAHATRFAPAAPDVAGAAPVAVSAGVSAVVNGSLPTQSTTSSGAVLSGTVTETGTGVTVPGAYVLALHASDYRLARATVTNSSGRYSLNVAPGDYKLVFIDPSGRHNAEWHQNQPVSNLGGAQSVTAPAVTSTALDATTGSLTGTVDSDPTGEPVTGAWVVAIGPNGVAGGAVTSDDGSYTMSGLAPGTYRATVVDPSGVLAQEFYENSSSFGEASVFAVAAAEATTVDLHLSPVP